MLATTSEKGAGTLSDWEFVKTRTAASGAVWRSCEGLFYKRTGTADLMAEAECLQELAGLGYPVPEVVETGSDETGQYFFVERSVGEASLHDQALVEAEATGRVGPRVLDAAAAVSARLLAAQARTPLPGGPQASRDWFERAGFTNNVFAENPDLDTARVRTLMEDAVGQLAGLPRQRPRCLWHRTDPLERQQVIPRQPDRITRLANSNPAAFANPRFCEDRQRGPR